MDDGKRLEKNSPIHENNRPAMFVSVSTLGVGALGIGTRPEFSGFVGVWTVGFSSLHALLLTLPILNRMNFGLPRISHPRPFEGSMSGSDA